MGLREAYTAVMMESLRNAERWVKDAKLLVEDGSTAHALALQNIAIEEIGKSYVCMLALKGVYSFNDPRVNYKDHRSVFKDHKIKNLYGMIHGISMILGDRLAEGRITLEDLAVKNPKGFINYLIYWTKQGAKRRMEWMYVDIIEVKGKLHILSPLSMNKDKFNVNFNRLEREIKLLKEWVVSTTNEETENWDKKIDKK